MKKLWGSVHHSRLAGFTIRELALFGLAVGVALMLFLKYDPDEVKAVPKGSATMKLIVVPKAASSPAAVAKAGHPR